MSNARKALVIGVNYYSDIPSLYGCATDAHSVKGVLERHSDGTINFDVKLMISTNEFDKITRTMLIENIKNLFDGDSDVALLYFAGHGHIDSFGGYIMTSESKLGHDGFSLAEMMPFINQSSSKNKIIVLDSCHSGFMGSTSTQLSTAELSEGVTILTASTKEQYATEMDGRGVFTSLFVDALQGGAANLVGDVSPGSIYSYIDQSLGSWDQRPVFKTNIKNFVSVRKVQPPISLTDLKKIIDLFPEPGFFFNLDPSFEPEGPCPNPEHTAQFSTLQNFNRVNLVVPVDQPHMYHAAMTSTGCKLTVLGEHYRRLAERKRI